MPGVLVQRATHAELWTLYILYISIAVVCGATECHAVTVSHLETNSSVISHHCSHSYHDVTARTTITIHGIRYIGLHAYRSSIRDTVDCLQEWPVTHARRNTAHASHIPESKLTRATKGRAHSISVAELRWFCPISPNIISPIFA